MKELIPEFFYCPELFENINGLDMGVTQRGATVGGVVLPPWARNARDFVTINREALESEHVSAHLHEWVDLVFGCKQRPPSLGGGSEATAEARNCFVHLTYEGAVDLAALKRTDPLLYEATAQQIDCFGQVPPLTRPFSCLARSHPPTRTSLLPAPPLGRPRRSCLTRRTRGVCHCSMPTSSGPSHRRSSAQTRSPAQTHPPRRPSVWTGHPPCASWGSNAWPARRCASSSTSPRRSTC